MKAISVLVAALVAIASPAYAGPSVGDASVISGVGTASISDVPVVAAESHGGWVSSYLFYNFEMYNLTADSPGPGQPPVIIPGLLTFGGFLSGADSGYYTAEAHISVGSYGRTFTCSHLDQSGCGSFSFTNEAVNFPAFQISPAGTVSGTIFLGVLAKNEHASGNAFAYLDPLFVFTPAFLIDNPNAFIEFALVTPIVVSVSDVPEPSTWMMLITGFGAVATALRIQRRHGGQAVRV